MNNVDCLTRLDRVYDVPMTHPTNSVAIRTLGTVGKKFLQELESVCAQTMRPKRIIVCVSKGYD